MIAKDSYANIPILDVSSKFLNNRINNFRLKQTFAPAVSFLRSEENVFPATFVTPEGVWENVLPIKYG